MYSIDIESYSECDIKLGGYRYAMDPSTDALCVVIDRRPDLQVRWVRGDAPPAFLAGQEFSGYNILMFDRLMWKFVLHPKYGWQNPDLFVFTDTMHRAAYTNLPGSLDSVARALGTSPKDIYGQRLMMSLCKPAPPIEDDSNPRRRHTLEAICRLVDYCAQDVKAELEVADKLPMLPARERIVCAVDQKVNDRGIFIDTGLVSACISTSEGLARLYRERLFELTGGAASSETDINGIANYCRSKGVPVTQGRGAMDKAAVESYMAAPGVDADAREVLGIRQMLGRSSLSKLKRMRDAVCPDSRIRGTLQYYGAHQTGRWAGRIIQPQNFPRRGLQDYDFAIWCVKQGAEAMSFYFGEDAFGVITALLRPCMRAAPGKILVVSDYNAIECRVLAWLAQEVTLLELFANGQCPYKKMASILFGIDVSAVTSEQRFIGKVIVLACGYGMGGQDRNGESSRFRSNALSMGLVLTPEEALNYVTTYRRVFAAIPALWYEVDRQAKDAIRRPGNITVAGMLAFKMINGNLLMRMPNGLHLWYRNAHISLERVPWSSEPQPTICFRGEIANGEWGRCNTHGAKLVENAAQALSRGITADALVRCETENMNPVVTIHDEIVCETERFSDRELSSVMCASDGWAADIPIKASGYTSPYYRK